MIHGRLRKAVITAAAGLFMTIGLVSSDLGTAGANHVTGGSFECGEVVVLNPALPTVLTNDVGPCPVGLTLGGLILQGTGTFDLAGKWITGTGDLTAANCAVAAPDADNGDGGGIYVLEGTGITITNSTPSSGGVRAFDAGVVIDGGSSNTVENLRLTFNKGVGEDGTDFGDGIMVRASTNNNIRANTIDCNGPYGGITLYASSRNTVGGPAEADGNTLTDNNVGPSPHATQEDVGIRLENGSNLNTIQNNTVTDSGLDGISIFNPGRLNTVTSNTVSGSGRYDLADFNACGDNSWTGNTEGTKQKTCLD